MYKYETICNWSVCQILCTIEIIRIKGVSSTSLYSSERIHQRYKFNPESEVIIADIDLYVIDWCLKEIQSRDFFENTRRITCRDDQRRTSGMISLPSLLIEYPSPFSVCFSHRCSTCNTLLESSDTRSHRIESRDISTDLNCIHISLFSSLFLTWWGAAPSRPVSSSPVWLLSPFQAGARRGSECWITDASNSTASPDAICITKHLSSRNVCIYTTSLFLIRY